MVQNVRCEELCSLLKGEICPSCGGLICNSDHQRSKRNVKILVDVSMNNLIFRVCINNTVCKAYISKANEQEKNYKPAI